MWWCGAMISICVTWLLTLEQRPDTLVTGHTWHWPELSWVWLCSEQNWWSLRNNSYRSQTGPFVAEILLPRYQDKLSHNSALLADIYWPLVTRMWEPENTSDWLLFDLAIDQQDFNLWQYQLHPSVLGTQLFNHDSPNNFTVNHLILNWANVTLMRMSVMMFTSNIHRKY